MKVTKYLKRVIKICQFLLFILPILTYVSQKVRESSEAGDINE